MSKAKPTTSLVANPVLPKFLSAKDINIIDRDREIRQMMYAIFTREHMLIMGPAGTGKSQMAANTFSTIDGAKVFKIHLTKQTTEEYVFGPIDIGELKKGNIVHNTSDSILDADFAFIDEFFDASDVLLRSLLGVLNERMWMKGQQQIKARLNTAILTSNYQRENEVTQAILDRIIFKCEVKPVSEKKNRLKIYDGYLNNPNFIPPKIIDLAELEKFTQFVEDPGSVTFSKEVLETYDEFLHEYTKELQNKYISQRTANKALEVLKVSALLDGRREVSFEDFEELKYVFCVLNRDMEERIFDTVYQKCVGSAEEEKKMLSGIEDIKKQVDALPADFGVFSMQEHVDTISELTENTRMLEMMTPPTPKVTTERNSLLTKIREIVEENKDKIFFKKKPVPKATP